MNAFDRAWARGPWRAAPVPAFLADRRAALRFQLSWAGGLALPLVVVALAATGWTQGRLLELGTLRLLGAQAVPALLLAMGAAAVVARGGLDWSAPGVAALAAGVAARQGSPALGLAAALACGLANGLLVALVRAPGWLLTALTSALLAAGARAAVFGDGGMLRADPEGARWLLALGAGVTLSAAPALVFWLQVRPRGGPASWLRERAGDVGVYTLSGVLAGVSGLWGLARMGGVELPPSNLSALTDTILIVVLGATWVGSGRPNVVGTAVASLLVAALRFGLTAGHLSRWAQATAQSVLLPLALGLGLLAHVVAARRYGRARETAGEPALREGSPRPGPKAFDRALFVGPGRVLPVPVHLLERRRALRLELGWNVGLLALLVAIGVAAWARAPWMLAGSGLSSQVRFLLVPLALALGASAVVARGGFDLSAPLLATVVAFLVARDGGVGAALAVAAGVGLGNGALVSLVRLPGWAATAVSAVILSVARLAAMLYGGGDRFLPAPQGLGWVPVAGWTALGLAAAVAFVWLQLGPGGDPDRPLVRWRERLSDGVPYLFSSALALVAGLDLVHLLQGASLGGRGVGELTAAAVIVAGGWLGSGRANVVGVILSTFALGWLRTLLMAVNAPPWSLEAPVAALALLALVASRVVHLLMARAGVPALEGGRGGAAPA